MNNSFNIDVIRDQNDAIHEAIVGTINAAEEVEKILKKLRASYASDEATPLINKIAIRIKNLKESNAEIHRKQTNAVKQSEQLLSEVTSQTNEGLNG